MVWIAAKFTEEHRAALDWLNENTGESFSFFGLEIEVWRIGNSPPAPKFNLVSKPNDWSKAVKGQTGREGLSEHQQLQFEFWTAFKTYLEENTNIKAQKPSYRHWLIHPIGRSGFNLASISSKWNTVNEDWTPEVRVELQLKSPQAAGQFAALQAMQEKLQTAIDLPLNWHKQELQDLRTPRRRFHRPNEME
jgi:hypothetical protein